MPWNLLKTYSKAKAKLGTEDVGWLVVRNDLAEVSLLNSAVLTGLVEALIAVTDRRNRFVVNSAAIDALRPATVE